MLWELEKPDPVFSSTSGDSNAHLPEVYPVEDNLGKLILYICCAVIAQLRRSMIW